MLNVFVLQSRLASLTSEPSVYSNKSFVLLKVCLEQHRKGEANLEWCTSSSTCRSATNFNHKLAPQKLWERPLSPNLFLIFVERHSKGKKGLHFGNLRIASLCFAVVLLVSLEFALQHSLERDESPYLQVWGHCSLLENNGMLPLGWGGESASSKVQVLIHKWWEDGDVSGANGLVLSQKTATWNLSYDWKSDVVGTSG